MATKSMLAEAGRANGIRYESPDEVAAYVKEPYHALRLDLAAMLMVQGVGWARPGTILELGAGGPGFAQRLEGTGLHVVAVDIAEQSCQAIRPYIVIRYRSGRRIRFRLPAKAFPGLAGSLIIGGLKRMPA